jgi:hypothetical protein
MHTLTWESEHAHVGQICDLRYSLQQHRKPYLLRMSDFLRREQLPKGACARIAEQSAGGVKEPRGIVNILIVAAGSAVSIAEEYAESRHDHQDADNAARRESVCHCVNKSDKEAGLDLVAEANLENVIKLAAWRNKKSTPAIFAAMGSPDNGGDSQQATDLMRKRSPLEDTLLADPTQSLIVVIVVSVVFLVSILFVHQYILFRQYLSTHPLAKARLRPTVRVVWAPFVRVFAQHLRPVVPEVLPDEGSSLKSLPAIVQDLDGFEHDYKELQHDCEHAIGAAMRRMNLFFKQNDRAAMNRMLDEVGLKCVSSRHSPARVTHAFVFAGSHRLQHVLKYHPRVNECQGTRGCPALLCPNLGGVRGGTPPAALQQVQALVVYQLPDDDPSDGGAWARCLGAAVEGGRSF